MSGAEATKRRAVAFIDGQNLFHAARAAFGTKYPDFDPLALAEYVCRRQGWQLEATYFYTGVPDPADNAFWHRFWTAKLGAMGHRGVRVFSRPLRYRTTVVPLPDGSVQTARTAEEKGIDVRLALDVIRLARRREYEVALIFSQDQDLSEVADEVRVIAREQGRWIKLVSAYPVGTSSRNRRGINKTDWIRIDETGYHACRDPRDYRALHN